MPVRPLASFSLSRSVHQLSSLLVLAVAAVLAAAVPSRADTLVYADGRRVQGHLVSVSRGWIEFQPLEGEDSVDQIRVATGEVRAIQFDDRETTDVLRPTDRSDDEPAMGSRDRRRRRGDETRGTTGGVDEGGTAGGEGSRDTAARDRTGVRRTGLPGRDGSASARTGTEDRRRGRMITVDAAERWTDTGFDVTAGDVISFSVAGTVTLGDDRPLSAGGDLDGAAPAARRPMPDRPAGALIGRIGTSPEDTFFIGAERLPFRVRTSGRLFLGINDDTLTDDDGAFQVSITRGPGTAVQ